MATEQEDKKTDQSGSALQQDPTAGGRNSTDNFNDDEVDAYGIDPSSPTAEEDLEFRITAKGGRGPSGGERNRNDDFDDDADTNFDGVEQPGEANK